MCPQTATVKSADAGRSSRTGTLGGVARGRESDAAIDRFGGRGASRDALRAHNRASGVLQTFFGPERGLRSPGTSISFRLPHSDGAGETGGQRSIFLFYVLVERGRGARRAARPSAFARAFFLIAMAR